jgi:hypothetical protein
MFDGEALAEDENIRLTRQHAEVVHAAELPWKRQQGVSGEAKWQTITSS